MIHTCCRGIESVQKDIDRRGKEFILLSKLNKLRHKRAGLLVRLKNLIENFRQNNGSLVHLEFEKYYQSVKREITKL